MKFDLCEKLADKAGRVNTHFYSTRLILTFSQFLSAEHSAQLAEKAKKEAEKYKKDASHEKKVQQV